MVGSQRVFSILDGAAATIGGWTALQSIRCVHLDSEGQDWELGQRRTLEPDRLEIAHRDGRQSQRSVMLGDDAIATPCLMLSLPM